MVRCAGEATMELTLRALKPGPIVFSIKNVINGYMTRLIQEPGSRLYTFLSTDHSTEIQPNMHWAVGNGCLILYVEKDVILTVMGELDAGAKAEFEQLMIKVKDGRGFPDRQLMNHSTAKDG